MSRDFTLDPAPGDSLATTCKGCGETYTHPNYSVLEVWRRHHRCPVDDAAAQGKTGISCATMETAPEVRQHHPGPDPTADLRNGRGAAHGT